ncbi:MAG: Gfo/Idh/MocA family oxidoreductase [Gemmatimonadota bacterium]
MRTIRWGIIGCGDVTEVKSGPALQKADHSALAAVMRRNGDLARDYAERHGVPRWYSDAQALIDDDGVDAIYVATPPSSHQEYVLRAAAAGKPVYVEKPMAMSFAQCRAMIDGCRDVGVPLFVAYYRRALERFVAIRKLVRDGTIGDIRYVNVMLHQPLAADEANAATLPWRVVPEIAGGGRFVDLASHMLDFLDYTLGPIREACGFAGNQARQYPAEDIVSGSFVFESGVQGTGTWCFSAFDKFDRTDIVGTKGKVTYSTFDYTPVVVTTDTGTRQLAFHAPMHIQQDFIQTIVNELNGVGECPGTGESAARTSWVMDQLLSNSR